MKTWYVELPAKVKVDVEADTEEEAIEKAFAQAELDPNPELELIEDMDQVVVEPN